MNSLVRQTARLGAQSLRLSTRRPIARKFSLASQVFENNTIIKNGAKPDYKRLAKHVVDPLLFYFPFMALVIGWPLMAEKIVDGNV